LPTCRQANLVEVLKHVIAGSSSSNSFSLMTNFDCDFVSGGAADPNEADGRTS
jgi:hypothetical protein